MISHNYYSLATFDSCKTKNSQHSTFNKNTRNMSMSTKHTHNGGIIECLTFKQIIIVVLYHQLCAGHHHCFQINKICFSLSRQDRVYYTFIIRPLFNCLHQILLNLDIDLEGMFVQLCLFKSLGIVPLL